MASDTQRLILVVEDDAGVATLQRRRLERADFRVIVASDVPAAMNALTLHSVDLVLLDYRLGTTTGLDLHRRMKAAGFDVPVILVSAAMEDSLVIEAIRAGVRDVVVKSPDYLDYLSDAVRAVLDQAAAVPERRRDDPVGTRVLVVEDDVGAATLERRQLQRAGYQVEIATSAHEALEIVRQGVINLMVLDLRLGETSGLDLYEQLRAEGWNIPAILVTGFADQAVAIRALRSGVRDFVPKTPDYLDYLPTAVDRVVAQVRVERKLVESELRLASIIGTTLDAIVMCDEQCRVVLFNRSAEQMFLTTAADAIDQPLDRFVPGLRLNGHRSTRGDRGGAMRQRREVTGVRSDGTHLPIEVSITDVVVNENRLFTVIARDVSERNQILAELREADRRKDEFLGMLAHELRNPLAAIMTAGEVLHRRVEETDAQKLTAVIRRQTQALARMVDDLLDVSRVTLGKIELSKEPLLLSEVVSRAAESNKETVSRAGLGFDVHIDGTPLWIEGDLTRLEQVLTNLVSNAVKFTPGGGRISIRAGREEDHAVIRVRDTGSGIPASVLPRVFDLFVQGDTSLARAKSGLGIGLALVRKLVRLHGGEVEAHSDGVGHGAEFVIALPISRVDGVSTPDDPQVMSAEPGSRLRVLVVDDQRDIADSIAMLIDHVGHDATAVYDGFTALNAMKQSRPDVMFIDVGMPGMTGYELATRIREDSSHAGLRLVALTGYGRAEDRARAMSSGFDLHITKPLSEGRLREVLAGVTSRP